MRAAGLDAGVLAAERAWAQSLGFGGLIAAVREPNTLPGGVATVDTLLQFAMLRPRAQVLDVGCATGWTAHEIAACCEDAEVLGIDREPESVRAAQEIADSKGLRNVRFEVRDATATGLDDASFDLIVCGNMPTFVGARSALLAELWRLLRPHGRLAATPISYAERPPDEVREAVQALIGQPIEVWDRSYWLDAYSEAGLTLRASESHRFAAVTQEQCAEYSAKVMARPVNADHPPERRQALEETLTTVYELFAANLAYAEYTVALMRKALVNDDDILFGAA